MIDESPHAPASPSPTMEGVFRDHPRRWQDFHYVYPVVSRRSGGLSIGINLNMDKACNFDCIYCCVDRSVAPVRRDVDLDQVAAELGRMIELAVSGRIWDEPRFVGVEPGYRRINDIAFSGDGEPTTYAHFDRACQRVIDLKRAYSLDDVQIIVITNAATIDRPRVRAAFELLDRHQGKIWAKLDAGTEGYYRLIDRTRIPLDKVLNNILACGRVRPIVVQSLFMQVSGQPVPDAEFDAYLAQLQHLIRSGCRIELVQLYTTARQTAEPYVTPLPDDQLDRLADRLRQKLPSLAVKAYYGTA